MQHQTSCECEDFMVVCPSFSSYATNGLAAIAATVADEFRCFKSFAEDDDDDFEFSLVLGDQHLDHAADEVICAGQIQIRPFIDRTIPDHRELIKIDRKEGDDQVRGDIDHDHDGLISSSMINIAIPLSELMFLDDREERYSSSTSSSSSCDSSSIMEEELMETDFSPKAHCFWRCRTPKSAGSESSSPTKRTWKKNSSTGSGTKRTWRLLDFLRRSNSAGDMSTSNPEHREGKVEPISKNIADHSAQLKGRNSVDSIGASQLQSLHELFYVRNKAAKKEEGCRRKSYLPYKQNLVGIFASANGMGRSYPV